ncbi:MAG: hypothetical protein JXR94_02160, partial [Candidatus Hydrogenedentes bacterium]|nr:hypothetical protein [Candidatus Hydrogenedentota bacterium]
DRVEVKAANGAWVPVENGGAVVVAAGVPIEARVTVTNLAEATWLPGRHRRPGGVYVVAEGAGETRTPLAAAVARHDSATIRRVRLTPAGIDGSETITLTFLAEGRTRFGQKFQVTLNP